MNVLVKAVELDGFEVEIEIVFPDFKATTSHSAGGEKFDHHYLIHQEFMYQKTCFDGKTFPTEAFGFFQFLLFL